jgi:hypothetical protein
MRTAQGAGQRGRRSRRSPPRRRDDVFEAWTVLIVRTFMALGGTLVGLVTADAADTSFIRLRPDRHATPAGRVGLRLLLPAGHASSNPDTNRSTVVIWMIAERRFTATPPMALRLPKRACWASAPLRPLGGALFGADGPTRWRLDQRRSNRWGSE